MPAPRDRTPILTDTGGELERADAWALFQAATIRLAGLHREIAQVRRQELAVKAQAWQGSTERSASGREDEARYAAARHTVEYMDLLGERDATAAELDFFKQYLHLNGG